MVGRYDNEREGVSREWAGSRPPACAVHQTDLLSVGPIARPNPTGSYICRYRVSSVLCFLFLIPRTEAYRAGRRRAAHPPRCQSSRRTGIPLYALPCVDEGSHGLGSSVLLGAGLVGCIPAVWNGRVCGFLEASGWEGVSTYAGCAHPMFGIRLCRVLEN